MSTQSATITPTKSPQKTQCSVSAVFQTEDKLNQVIRQLLDQNISRDDISVIGKNFQSQTKIAGFLTRKDIILDGLKNGAIFGSLFGSLLSLLSGVGVLFIPFVGPVVAAGPLGAALLGAATGAIAGSAGAGLVSALVALGMPEEKATIYQTRVQAGEFLLVAEVPIAKTDTVEQLFQEMGGEEILACPEMTIPRHGSGSLTSPADLSPEIRSHLSEAAQAEFVQVYNKTLDESQDENAALTKAWQAVEKKFERDSNGYWSLVIGH
ncbi:MAG: hypothetical protein F6K31_41760 [Symploca sp. SIO2G7]|nr:hypothetical protein [Symploca sp. SIO2G7]